MSKKVAHKKKYRGNKKHDQNKKKKISSIAKLPSSSEEYSSNWQKLSGQISQNSTKKHPEKKRPMKKKEKEVQESKPDIWFDDVDVELLDPEDRPDNPPEVNDEARPFMNRSGKISLVKEKSFEGLTKVVGIDCEMVGVGFQGSRSVLARVSIVNIFGKTMYDKFVKPMEKVTDYRTTVSGIRPSDVVDGEEFKVVQKEVASILDNRILVGHALKHDLKVLFLGHSEQQIRDTSLYKPFRELFNGRTPSLKKLTAKLLSVSVQEGEHSPVEDARAAVRLYTMFRTEWEKSLKKVKPKKRQMQGFFRAQEHLWSS
uniref:RNA exonuclease 4 n=1 Tax=Caligus rogercresseyi TaxID=217165 RepID=C1BPG0_CALRO|nr:RNA exonuclease 4 [Caligus rogercresseyi]